LDKHILINFDQTDQLITAKLFAFSKEEIFNANIFLLSSVQFVHFSLKNLDPAEIFNYCTFSPFVDPHHGPEQYKWLKLFLVDTILTNFIKSVACTINM